MKHWARETAPFQNKRIIASPLQKRTTKPRAMCFQNGYRHLNIQPFKLLRTSKGTLITINFRTLQRRRQSVSSFFTLFFILHHETKNRGRTLPIFVYSNLKYKNNGDLCSIISKKHTLNRLNKQFSYMTYNNV